MNTRESRILTIKKNAKYLKIAERTIYQVGTARKIPGFKVGGIWRLRTVDIDGRIVDHSKKAEYAD